MSEQFDERSFTVTVNTVNTKPDASVTHTIDIPADADPSSILETVVERAYANAARAFHGINFPRTPAGSEGMVLAKISYRAIRTSPKCKMEFGAGHFSEYKGSLTSVIHNALWSAFHSFQNTWEGYVKGGRS